MTIAAQTGQKPGFVPLLSFYLFYLTAVKILCGCLGLFFTQDRLDCHYVGEGNGGGEQFLQLV